MDIDPGNLLARFADGFPNAPGSEPTDPFFDRFDRADATIVRQIVPGDKGQPTLAVGEYWFSPGLLLLQRGKTEELFDGSYGVVSTHLEYYYDRARGATPSILFNVRPYYREVRRDQPKAIKALPPDASKINAITAIRIFPADSEVLITVGTYSPEGDLMDITADRTAKGDLAGGQPSNDIRIDMRAFGFPARFPLEGYQLAPHALEPVIDLPCLLTVISFHYNLNRWVRQDVYPEPDASSIKRETRFLEYRFTPQDAALDAVDRSLPFTAIDRCRMDRCMGVAAQ